MMVESLLILLSKVMISTKELLHTLHATSAEICSEAFLLVYSKPTVTGKWRLLKSLRKNKRELKELILKIRKKIRSSPERWRIRWIDLSSFVL